MSDAVIYIDSSEIRPGKREQLQAAMSELAGFVEANEPWLPAYNFYTSEAADRMTVFALHPDARSLERHLEMAGPGFRKFADLIRLLRIDVYGTVSEALLGRLREKARMLGSGTVVAHRRIAGFFRPGGR
jgi:hypothetical protein